LRASALLAARRSAAAESEARIEVLLEEPIGVIRRTFTAISLSTSRRDLRWHWVGEKSKVPNYGGIRAALVEHMKRLKPSVVRWPGGCFADSYNWRDGIARAKSARAGPTFGSTKTF